MSQHPHPHEGFHPGEQSWIVLDEQGWSSRPPTASPSRQLSRQGGGLEPVPKAAMSEEDESDNEEERRIRRLGMDRDVREALELAERSLELAGSAEEFAPRLAGQPDEDGDVIRDSPMMNYVGRENEGVAAVLQKTEDPYQGRNPPINRRPTLIVDGGTAPPSPGAPRSTGSPFVPFAATPASPSSSSSRALGPKPNERPATAKAVDPGEGTESTLLQWLFGLSPHSSPIPIILSHLLTLAAGYYLGTRRAYSAPPVSNTVAVTSASAQSVNQ